MENLKIVIVGAGVAGLHAAYKLGQGPPISILLAV
jgi:protoporphyrinogen oxidase